MPSPPLPDVSCVRVNMTWNEGGVGEGGQRFYLSYSGSAPSGTDCTTLASDIADAANTSLVPLTCSNVALNEVDVLDITTRSGSSGQWQGSYEGTRSGTELPVQVAVVVEFNIARRYRGGKPRMFLYAGAQSDLQTDAQWHASYTDGVSIDVGDFFAAIGALSVGSMGTLKHVNLSYYDGWNTSTPPWRGPGYKYPPKYRATALHDDVEGYAAKGRLGSQKRRRSSTTP